MQSNDWLEIKKIFYQALDLPHAERDLFLAGQADSVRSEVAQLITSHEEAENFIADSAIAELGFDGNHLVGKNIGGYQIIEAIGSGGMGQVFLAEKEGLDKKFALKIIKRGMDTDAVLKRFSRERQILSRLEHPCVAQLLDGGSTDDGLPFFVMEYVEGLPVTRFCDEHRFDTKERLELFRQICSAVAYSHQNLIVHRDLKPSNILITKDGTPKLLDFGIAKLLNPDGYESTATATQGRIFTPEYASPEHLNGLPITTASDVYSLGVVLYELLSGQRPFRSKSRNYLDIANAVLTEEPVRPSSVVSSKFQVPGSKSENRTDENNGQRTSDEGQIRIPHSAIRNLKGDLDNIILKTLRKEPERRFQSVQEFSEDIRRYLTGLPVTATADTRYYRLSKFVTRNKIGTAIATVILLLSGIAVWQGIVARRERERAERRLTEIRKLTNNLVSGWEKGIPSTQITNQVTGRIADISSEYLENLANEINDPQIIKELANAYLELGHRYAWEGVNVDKAKASFQKAEAISRQLIADNPNDLEAKDLLVRSLGKFDEFFGDLDRSQSLQNHLERLRLSEEIYAAEPNEKTLGNLSKATHNFGWILKRIGRRDEAVTYFRRSNELYQQRINSLEPIAKTLDERNKLSGLYSWSAMQLQEELGNLQLSLEYYRRSVQIADAVYQENPENDDAQLTKTSAEFDLGEILKKTGDFKGSIEAFRESLSVAQNYILRSPNDGYMNEKITDGLLKIAENFDLLGDDKSALKAIHESFAHQRKTDEFEINRDALQKRPVRQAYLFYAGGRLLARMNKFDEARIAFDESEAAFNKVLNGGTDQIGTKQSAANLYLTMGDFYAGLGVCKSKTVDYDYCPSEMKGVSTTNRNSLRKAKKYYEDALNILTAMDAKNLLLDGYNENLRIAQEKVALCNKKLIGKS